MEIYPGCSAKADQIIAISEFTKKEIIRLCGIDGEKIKVIYLGVDREKYRPMRRFECRKKFGLKSDEKLILVVASNLPHKRMDLTKRIFDDVRKAYPDVKLIKIGYGDILHGDGIINLGWVREEDMPALYNTADVFLHTAEYEGFGLPVLEAMACGIPVVVSKKASLPEIVGDSDSLVDIDAENCVDIFKEKIIAQLNKLPSPLMEPISKQFSWVFTAKDTIQPL